MKRPVGAVCLLIFITERHIHFQLGIRRGKLRLSKTPLQCGQVLTRVAKTEKGVTKGKILRAEGIKEPGGIQPEGHRGREEGTQKKGRDCSKD